jgi:SAM-dependent methyltransferase
MAAIPQIEFSDRQECAETVREIYLRHFDQADPEFESMVMRHTFYLKLLRQYVRSGTVVDIGGGWGTFNCALALQGYRSILVDDFLDRGFLNANDPRLSMAEKYGVIRQSRDVVRDGLEFAPGSVDAFTCLDSMEHWHSSPKKLFHQVAGALRPRGVFILAGPNCVNLRKRISTLLGTAQWTSMAEWYEQASFRSHVREPNVRDLKYIANDLGMKTTRIVGRNFAGYAKPSSRLVTSLLDPFLRLRPTLCSDICLVAQKRAS